MATSRRLEPDFYSPHVMHLSILLARRRFTPASEPAAGNIQPWAESGLGYNARHGGGHNRGHAANYNGGHDKVYGGGHGGNHGGNFAVARVWRGGHTRLRVSGIV